MKPQKSVASKSDTIPISTKEDSLNCFSSWDCCCTSDKENLIVNSIPIDYSPQTQFLKNIKKKQDMTLNPHRNTEQKYKDNIPKHKRNVNFEAVQIPKTRSLCCPFKENLNQESKTADHKNSGSQSGRNQKQVSTPPC